jgi:hypothetical protein
MLCLVLSGTESIVVAIRSVGRRRWLGPSQDACCVVSEELFNVAISTYHNRCGLRNLARYRFPRTHLHDGPMKPAASSGKLQALPCVCSRSCPCPQVQEKALGIIQAWGPIKPGQCTGSRSETPVKDISGRNLYVDLGCNDG